MKDQESNGRRPRRNHEQALKAELVERSLQPGASVSAIALEAGINANLLFKWRRDTRRRQVMAATPAVLLPVHVVSDAVGPRRDSSYTAAATTTVRAPATRTSRPGVIELEIAGAQLRLRGDVDEDSLCTVLRALRNSA